MTNPYERFNAEDLILRDELAIERTILANERTLLAYLRSGLALILAGVTIIHFAHDQWFRAVGIVCLPLGILMVVLGLARYRTVHRKITMARAHADQHQAPP